MTLSLVPSHWGINQFHCLGIAAIKWLFLMRPILQFYWLLVLPVSVENGLFLETLHIWKFTMFPRNLL